MKPACLITGAGIVSPLGAGLEPTRRALAAGRSGIGPIRAFEAAGFPVRAAGEVADPRFPLSPARPEAMAHAALDEAWALAGLPPLPAHRPPEPRWALSFAWGKPTIDLAALHAALPRWQGAADAAALLASAPELAVERARWDPAALLDRLAARCGLGGARYSSYTACASGNDAIGLGKRLIERGEADLVVAGASDAQVHPLSLIEFELLSALSHDEPARACRPFDRGRTGFVVGEGAAAVVLESAEHARRRGAAPLAELAGYGASLDAFGLTKCHPRGRGAAQAMRAALADAGCRPADIAYINAHGTGTVLNDQAEAAAVVQVWGDTAARQPISSTKAMTGHLLTAASAVEAVITLLAVQDGLLPPNLNFETPDPECPLALVTAPRREPVAAAMSNGFGFGGQNSSIILRRADRAASAGAAGVPEPTQAEAGRAAQPCRGPRQ